MNVPYKCPVCLGKGVVPFGFYTTPDKGMAGSPEQCKSCNGSGVLWGFDWTQPAPYIAPVQPQPWQPWQPPSWPQWPYGGGTICQAR